MSAVVTTTFPENPKEDIGDLDFDTFVGRLPPHIQVSGALAHTYLCRRLFSDGTVPLKSIRKALWKCLHYFESKQSRRVDKELLDSLKELFVNTPTIYCYLNIICGNVSKFMTFRSD